MACIAKGSLSFRLTELLGDGDGAVSLLTQVFALS